MSHWTEVKTGLRDLAALEEAARELNCGTARNGRARGYANSVRQADLVIVPPESPYDVAAAVQEDGSISLATDWLGGYVEKALGKDYGLLKQRYALKILKQKAAFLMAETEETVEADGSIRLIVRGA